MIAVMIIYFLIGVFAGLFSGLLGIGSGVFVVPALVFVFSRQQFFPPDLIMHVAAGTCLAGMVFTTSRSLLSHLQRQVSFWGFYKKLAPGLMVGTILGALFADSIHSQTLSIIFSIVIFLSGMKMFFRFELKVPRSFPGNVVCSIAGLIIGGKSGLLGLGGGSISVPFLRYFNVPIRQTIAVSSAIGVTVSIIGSVSFGLTGLDAVGLPSWMTGYIYWPAWFGLFLGSLIFVPLGVKLSHYLSAKILHRIFAVFLLLVSVYMLYVVW